MVMGWYGLETYSVSLRMFLEFWLVKVAQLGFRDCNYYEVELHVKCASFSSDNGRTQYCPFFNLIFILTNFIPKYLDNALTDFA